jgi:beta-lactam-binding protein with PASTA domain
MMKRSTHASDNPVGSSPSLHLSVLGVLGGLLLVAGGGLIVVDGLGMTVTVIDKTSARMTAVIVGALFLVVSFVLRQGIASRDTKWLIGAVAVVAAFLVLIVTLEDPRIPDVRGLRDHSAEVIIDQIGIDVRSIESVTSDEPSGEIVDQDPNPGQRGDVVALTVSKGPDLPVLADVITLSEVDARRVLAAMGVSIDTEFVVGTPKGSVMRMIPGPRERSLTVLLFVAGGGELPLVADWVGSNEGEAIVALEAAGIVVSVESRERPLPIGEGVEQMPDPGQSTSVAVLVVSAGPGLPVLPDVVNRQADAVVATLSDLGIAVTITEEASDDAPAATVIRQDPAIGTRTDSVSLIVSSGPQQSSFIGEWFNVDPDTPGITRMVISNEDALALQVFLECQPEDCDWGSTTARLVDAVLAGTYTFDFKTAELRIERAGPFLLVEIANDYSEDGAEPDRTDVYVLAQQEGVEITSEELAVIVQSPIIDDLVRAGIAPHIPALVESAIVDVANG